MNFESLPTFIDFDANFSIKFNEMKFNEKYANYNWFFANLYLSQLSLISGQFLFKFGHLIINDYIANPEMTWTVHPAEELDLLEAKVQLKSKNFKD